MSYKLWLLKINKKKCSFCEVCSLRCPAGAIKLRRVGEFDKLIFYPKLCNGCDGKPSCKEHCPEQALIIKRVEGPPRREVSLIKARVKVCLRCGAKFVSQKKFDKVIKKTKVTKSGVHLYCPDCRRRRLIQTCLSR
jgi:ferredoxin